MNSRHWQKTLLSIVLCLILIWLVIIIFEKFQLFYQPMLIPEGASGVVQLEKSMSATAFASMLQAKHLISSEKKFLSLVRTHGLAQDLQAGFYQIKSGETCLQFLYRVAAGDVIRESFRIIDGTTQRQIAANLAKSPYLNYQDNDWLSVSNSNPEGLLLADTYNYNAGSSAKEILIRAHIGLQKYLEESWQKCSPGLPWKTSYELLIAASIIEKEAALPEEKRLIAGVIVNRLLKHMPLQMDPTVIYALGANFSGKLTHDDLQIKSPYNTYHNLGLPPTPIAMVGKEAIDAAANPKHTDYLYFVARGDGSHEFSVTYEQQKQAIARYIFLK